MSTGATQGGCPLVSIVVPTYNHDRFLPAAVASILGQRNADFELIIVNDGSTDGTRSFLDTIRNERVRVIHQENARLPGALNAGFAIARGELLTWTSDDNLLAPEFLETHRAALAAHPEVVMSVSAHSVIDEEGRVLREHRLERLSFPSVLRVNPGIASFMYRRASLRDIGPYDPQLEGAEDWDMWLRILARGRAVYIPRSLYHYREHRLSMTAQKHSLVERSSRQAFLNAVTRMEGCTDIARVYPWIAACEERDAAILDAHLDLGIGLLHSPYADPATTCAVLERAHSLSGGDPTVTAARALACARAGHMDEARSLARATQGTFPVDLNAVVERIGEDPDGADLPPFTLHLEGTELMKQERRVHPHWNPAPVTEPVSGGDPRPDLSVVITTYNRPRLLERCLRSFGAQTLDRTLFEVIVVDDGSTPPARQVVDALAGVCLATCIVQENAGLAAARNAGIAAARGRIVVPFDDDNIAAPDYLERHYRYHRQYPDAGDALLGHLRWAPGMEITPVMHHATVVDPRLWSTAGLRDGEVLPFGYLWGGCSSYKKELIDQAGGFDPRFTFGYEDSEAELRMARLGLRVRYDSQAVINVVKPVTVEDLCRRAQKQGESLRRLQATHAADPAARAYVASQRGAGTLLPSAQLGQIREIVPFLLARGWDLPAEGTQDDPASLALLYRLLTMLYQHALETGMREGGTLAQPGTRLRVLVIAPELPAYDRSAGGRRMYEILKLLAAQGHAITFIGRGPIDGVDLMPYIRALRDLGIEVFPLDPDRIKETWGVTIDHPRVDLPSLLSERAFDVAMISFYQVAAQYLPILRRHSPRTRILLDTVDLHFLREQRRAELTGDPALLEEAQKTKTDELGVCRQADAVLVVSDDEQRVLAEHAPGLTINVLPLIHEVRHAGPPFAERRDIMFAGGFIHQPNIDAVLHFHEHVWPLVASELPDIRWYIVGNQPPPEVRALGSERVIVTGFVPEIREYLDRCRVSVAPLRYGAGVKGKVGEAMAAGLPVVASPIALEGVGAIPGAHLVLAESDARCAEQIIRLYRDEVFWGLIARQGREFIEEHYAPAAVGRLLNGILGGGGTLATEAAHDLLVVGMHSASDHRTWLDHSRDLRSARRALTSHEAKHGQVYAFGGVCRACGSNAGFEVNGALGWEEEGGHVINWRETITCRHCGLSNRMRASVDLLESLLHPDPGSSMYITEQRGPRFALLRSKFPALVGSEYLGPELPPGATGAGGTRNEDLTALTFTSAAFDLVLSFDVLEHIPDVDRALAECFRVLKPGGTLFMTVPFAADRETSRVRAVVDHGQVRHLLPPEVHGDPIRAGGALAFHSFGWDLLERLRAAGFSDASAYAYWSRTYGYLGEDQMVFVAGKAPSESGAPAGAVRLTTALADAPAFSIIIPAHNNADMTRHCLESIDRCRGGSSCEVILIDNGSTEDLSGTISGRPENFRLIRNDRNDSYAKANNQGARAARGRYLVFLNNDTQVLPGWLEALEGTFAGDPFIGIQGGKLLYPDGRVQHAGIVYGPVNDSGLLLHYHLHLLADRNAPQVNTAREFQMVTGAMLAIRRDLFENVGGFDEGYYFGHEDLDLCMKVRAAGRKVWYNPRASAVHFESLTKKLLGVEKFERYITHPESYDAANDRRFHAKWDGALTVDADRYYREDGIPAPLGTPRPVNERKLRILFTMFGWSESGGGTTFPRAVSKRLARRGHELTVFCAAGRHPSVQKPYYLERREEDGVTVYGLYNRGSVFLDAEEPDREVNDPEAVARFREVLSATRPDLIHIHNLLGLSFEVARAAKEAGVPVVYTPHNYHLIDPMLYMIGQDLHRWNGIEFFENSSLPRLHPERAESYGRRADSARELLRNVFDCTFAVSSRVRDILIEFGMPPEKGLVVHQVHETVEPLRRIVRQRAPRSLPVRFGYLGGVMPHKGGHLLARAAQGLSDGEATFSLYGFVSDEYRRALQAIDRRNRLTICGAYTDRDLPTIAGSVDVMILPSLWEDCAPFSITESLAMGCPVIAPRIGGFPDFVRDGWNGRLFPAGDAGALEKILGEVVADPSAIDSWAAHTEFPLSIDQYVDHAERLYAALVKGRTVQPERDSLLFFSDARPPGRSAEGDPSPMNRQRLAADLAGGFSNSDATGVLPTPLPSPLYLNLGCGRDLRKGFVNIDLFSDDPGVVRMDIRRLELPDNSVDGLVAHDVLEHFSHREVDAVLREWARVLKPGAEFMIRCPSLALQCKAYMNGSWDADVASYMIFGGQTNPGDYHCTGFDRASISRHLQDAGLVAGSIQEDDTPQDHGYINLNMTVKGRKGVPGTGAAAPQAGIDRSQPINVVWEGEQFARHSLALVNRELCVRLAARSDVHLALAGAGEPTDESDERLARLSGPASRESSDEVDVHVRHLWPANLVPPPSGRWVVIQPWEYGSLPRAWVDAYKDAVDEFWVPSRYVRECYLGSGIPADRVVVIPNGVDGTVFRPGVKPLRLSTKKKFKFLFVGGTLHRKGFDLLLEAYGNAFKRSDSVCLIVKDMGGPSMYEGVNARALIKEFVADRSHPAIEYIDRSLDQGEMTALYAAADCLVHPYRGEGFGLPIAEAMASEIPVIVTGAGAAMDFCTNETAYLLPARKGRLAEKSIGGVETVDYPWLFEPDGEELVRLMKHVRTHRTEAQQKARAARRHVLETLSWQRSADSVRERLEALRQQPVRRFDATPKETVRAGAPQRQHHPQVEPALRRVRELELRDQMQEAESLLNALAQNFPADPTVHLAFLRFLVGAKRFDEASGRLVATPLGLKADPAWLEITAEVLEGRGSVDDADACAAQILERSPHSVPALSLRGRAAAQRGDGVAAERFFREAIAADPEAGEPRALLGSVYIGRGAMDEGASMIEEAFRRSPLNGDILVTLVEVLRSVKRADRAADLVGEAAARHPASKRLRYFHAELLAETGRTADALSAILGSIAEFGVNDASLSFALNLRLEIGPLEILPTEPRGSAVSACMIIKNEEQFLAQCLWSILPLVQEIIVLDTGSTDRSEEIAAAFGAKVFHAEWTNDFADARNRAMEPATGDWILSLDGDEVISPSDHEAFRSMISSSTRRNAYSFVTRNYLVPMNVIGWIANDGTYKEEAGTGWIPSEKTRLFPRQQGIYFENPVHELVERSLQEAGITVARTEIPIHHYGKLDAARTKEKAEVYLELGRKKLAESGEDDIKAMFELAFQENDLGNYEEALRLYQRILQIQPGVPKVHFAIGANLGTLHRYEEAVPALEKAIEIDPGLKEAYVHLALVQLSLGHPEAALSAVERLAGLKIDYPPGTALRAAVRFITGDIDGGREALRPLEQRGMAYLQYFTEFARHLRTEGKPGYAVRILEPFVNGEETPAELAALLVDCYRDMAMAPDLHEEHV